MPLLWIVRASTFASLRPRILMHVLAHLRDQPTNEALRTNAVICTSAHLRFERRCRQCVPPLVGDLDVASAGGLNSGKQCLPMPQPGQPKVRSRAGLAQAHPTRLDYTGTWGGSSAGRAPRSHRGGQGFDPPPLHHQVVQGNSRKAGIPHQGLRPFLYLITSRASL